MSDDRRVIQTPQAPDAIGPYSQAIQLGDWVWCSGQIGLDPKSGELVDGGIEAQTKRALDNLGAVLGLAGSGYQYVVKTTVYLADFDDFATMNEVYAGYFQSMPPARSTIQAGALPKGALVEIDAVAYRYKAPELD